MIRHSSEPYELGLQQGIGSDLEGGSCMPVGRLTCVPNRHTMRIQASRRASGGAAACQVPGLPNSVRN